MPFFRKNCPFLHGPRDVCPGRRCCTYLLRPPLDCAGPLHLGLPRLVFPAMPRLTSAWFSCRGTFLQHVVHGLGTPHRRASNLACRLRSPFACPVVPWTMYRASWLCLIAALAVLLPYLSGTSRSVDSRCIHLWRLLQPVPQGFCAARWLMDSYLCRLLHWNLSGSATQRMDCIHRFPCLQSPLSECVCLDLAARSYFPQPFVDLHCPGLRVSSELLLSRSVLSLTWSITSRAPQSAK